MKRTYARAAAVAQQGGFGVALDTRALLTPAKRPLLVPTRALAAAIGGEWQAQGAEIRPHSMPMMRLASIAIDLVAERREAVIGEVAGYAATDLVCYRAEQPPELIARQQAMWQPLVDWATLRYDAPLTVTSGVVPVAQSPATLRAFAAAVAAYDPMMLTALHAATTACGSVVIALAMIETRLDAATAFAASQLDESFQIEHWGEDAEQARRRAGLDRDIAAAARFAELLRG